MMITRRTFSFTLLAAAAAAGASLVTGALSPKKAFAAEAGRKKSLVVFYSWSGNTKSIAARMHQIVGGELKELELATPYPDDYEACVEAAKNDQKRKARPALRTQLTDISHYDVVYLGYPNWWGTCPMQIATLLESYDFSGKIIAPFCSHGGGGLGRSVADIATLAPQAKVIEGFAVRSGGGSALPRDMENWLKKNYLIA